MTRTSIRAESIDRSALRFLFTTTAWLLTLFGLLRTALVQSHLLVPLARAQEAFARHGLSGPARVSVTLDCAGADVMALCAGVLLAFPASWVPKLLAATGSLVWILLLNSLRIAVLERAAGSSSFALLHLYVLPALLQLGAAAYVFGWMWWWTRPNQGAALLPAWSRSSVSRFAFFTVVLLGLYVLITPALLGSAFVAAIGAALATAAASSLNFVGASAQAAGDVLHTPRGSFSVTAECVLTPLMPVALAAALAWPTTIRRRLLLVFATLPFFAGVSLARILVLALPAWLLVSPLVVAHGFRQGVLGLICIAAACLWRRDPGVSARHALGRFVFATLAAVGAALIGGPPLVRCLMFLVAEASFVTPHVLTSLTLPGDEQGALAVLPAFQLGLLVALLVARRAGPGRSLIALVGLIASQVVLLLILGEGAFHLGVELPALAVRGIALAVPIALAFGAELSHPRSYERFWHDVGEQFPDLGGAASTDFYRANEIRLFQEHMGDLRGRRVFKTDLWDEARNTRILQWVHAQGARVFGADISAPTLSRARAGFLEGGLQAAVGDVRRLPFAGASFDLVYSMGTIEHFTDSQVAAAEIFRLLKPGGRAIVGVPNRLDPFLRPWLVSGLSVLGLYDYGYERSFTRRQIRVLLEGVGFKVVAEPAILFIPGWLRMLDLWCHCHCRPLVFLPAAGVAVFVWLDRHIPAVRRYGYLLATVVVRPDQPVSDSRFP